MTRLTHKFIGWAQAGLPVIVGPAPAGTVSLATLGEPAGYALLLPLLIALTGESRQGALTIVHYAVYAVSTVLIAPLVFDRVALDVAPNQLGVVLDEQAGLTAVWVDRVDRIDVDRPMAHAGALAMRLLAPITEEAHRAGKVSARGVTNIALDALAAGCRRLERSCGSAPSAGWVEELIAATDHPEYRSARLLWAQPDAGPPVEFRMPRTCCVLHKQPGPHACPTCPQYPDDATRLRRIDEWLGALNDDDFRAVTGRARVSPIGS